MGMIALWHGNDLNLLLDHIPDFEHPYQRTPVSNGPNQNYDIIVYGKLVSYIHLHKRVIHKKR